MKICPQCHDEYRDDIETCLECNILLESPTHGALKTSSLPAEEVDMATAVKVFEGALDACKEVERMLKPAKIAFVMVPSAGKFAICLNPEKVEAFAGLMRERFEGMVAREHSAEWTLKDVHLDGGDVTCPACGHHGALLNGQCADCGLMLAVNEA